MNRILWSIIGALLLALGVVGIIANQGRLSTVDRGQALLTDQTVNQWNRTSALAAGLTIAGGLLLAVLGFLLLRAQLRGRGGAPMRDLSFGPTNEAPADRAEAGLTGVSSSALHHALERDLTTDRAVRRAAVRLTGPTRHPQLLVRLAVTPDADIAHVAGHLDQAVHRFAATSGVTPDLSDVVVRIPARTPQRVQ